MIKRRLASLVVAVAAVSVCAAWSYYVEPTSPDAATMRVVNTSKFFTELKLFKVAADCSGGKLLVNRAGGLEPETAIEFKIAPDQETSFFISVGEYIGHPLPPRAACIMPATFKAEKNAAYLVTFIDDPTDKVQHCRLNISRVDGATPVPEPSARDRKWRGPFLESGSFCKKE